MANYTLPAATSVVDFLNSSKQDSSFGARSKLYSSAGLGKRLGEFKGTTSQNMALLDHLKSTNAPPQTGATGVLGLPKDTGTINLSPVDFSKLSLKPPAATSVLQTAGAPAVPSPTYPVGTPGTDSIDFEKLQMGKVSAPDAPSLLKAPAGSQAPDFSRITDTTPKPPQDQASRALSTIAPSTPAPSAPGTATQVTDTTKTTPGGTTTTVSSDTIYPGASQSESDLVTEFMNSQEGQSLADKQQRGEIDATAANEEAKRLLEQKYQADRVTLENNLAQSGLAFSGIRNSQLKALADNLAASELNVDRQLASKLLDSNASLRDGILKGVADLVKSAQDKNKEAIQQLNAVGLAVVGGKLVPTLASRNADRAAAQQEVANARAQANFQLQEKRLALSEASAARAEARFQQLYGAGKVDFFGAVKQLIDGAGDATEQDIKLAIRANPDIFGKPSEAELKDALTLIGPSSSIQDEIAIQSVAGAFDVPSVFSRILPGDQTAPAFEAAKTKAKQALVDSRGTIEVTDAAGKAKTYNLNSEQLQSLIDRIDTVSIEEAKAAK